ncbi:MAG: ABC transporter substrate-binding protein [Bdellovibrionaceae bacterium]|nr:ABC transporter substrate-binding protein [Pseudobdellovibrionaceae bacterium]|tara:strand:+ start:272 stop:1366 length:1095 start_codon:yes stop_codon:yes gene_type:complete
MGKKLNRRHFLKKATFATTAGTLGFPLLLNAKEKIQWKMVTTWPKNFPALGTGANLLAKNIEALTQGQIKIKVYGAGELVPALGVFDAVKKGTAQMGHGAAYYWKGKHEATQIFAAVPFGMNALEMNAWIHHGGGQKLWDELYSGFGLKAFPAGNTGVQMGGWFKKDINSISDYKGLKMRMPGLGGEVIRRMGATVVTLPGGEIFQSLKSGAIDATEWVGPYNDLAFGLHKAAKTYYWPGWHEPTAMLEAMINKQAFENLSPALQKAVELACQASTTHMMAEYTARNAIALQTLVKKHGVQLKKFPDSVLKLAGKTSQSVLSEIASKDPMTQKIYKSYLSFKKQLGPWDEISERGYSLARSLTS